MVFINHPPMQKTTKKKSPPKTDSVFDKATAYAGSFEQAIVPAATGAGSRKKPNPPFAGKKAGNINTKE